MKARTTRQSRPRLHVSRPKQTWAQLINRGREDGVCVCACVWLQNGEVVLVSEGMSADVEWHQMQTLNRFPVQKGGGRPLAEHVLLEPLMECTQLQATSQITPRVHMWQFGYHQRQTFCACFI